MNNTKRNWSKQFDSASVKYCNQTSIAMSCHVDMRNVLFGYYEEYLSPMTPLNHDNALCSVIEDIDCVIVDYGKDTKQFLNLSTALDWAKSVMGGKVFRYVDLSLFGGPGFYLDDYMDALRDNADNLIDFFVDSFNRYGWSISPFQLAHDVEITSEFSKPELVEAVFNFAKNIHCFSAVGPERSPWFMSQPTNEGSYYVCRFNGKVELVDLKLVHSVDGRSSKLMIFGLNQEPVPLDEAEAGDWLWSFSYHQTNSFD
ncbi:hypothetical protein J7H87_002347 [Vibrio parahaemolyticus]|nr:hypothetical protein [Vibrio parahaemolyticus]EHK0060616.1 hypothetical protein [Vibrio parahaemolyticus]